jgi:WD40 repeat protein
MPVMQRRFVSLCAFSVSLCLCGSLEAADKITYEQHIQPLLREKCFACHNQDKKKGGLQLHTYTNLLAGGSSGEAVKPGDPAGSRLYRFVAHKEEPYMPPNAPPIANEQVELIRRWIAGGCLENAGSKAAVVNKPKVEIGLTSIVKGKPPGPPPMPDRPLSLEPLVRSSRPNAVTALAASPWAPLVAVAGQQQVVLYHADTLELLGVLPFPEGEAHVLRFSRNGSLLLAGGGHAAKSGKVVVWSVKTGERLFTVGDETDSVLAADISADQTQIALGGPSKVVRVYSTKDGKLLHEIRKHTDWIYAIEYSPDGVLLATGDRNGGLFVWEAHTGREYFSLRGHTAAVTDLSWRTDSNVLASASEDTTIRLWEMENGNAIKTWGAHGGGVEAVKYARDGRLVSCGRDRLASVWDQNGTRLRAFEAFPDVALRVAFSPDAARVIGGDWSGQVRVWTTADGKVAGTLSTNPLPVAEQLAAANQELATRQAAYDQLVKSAAQSQAASQKAAVDLAAAQSAAADANAVAKLVNDALARAKDGAGRANAALAGAQAQLVARDVYARALAEAAVKVKDAADKARDNKELAASAAKAKQLADQAAAELAAVRKSHADLNAAAKAANEELATAQRASAIATGPAVAANKQVEVRTAPAKAAAAKAAADKAALDQATAALAAAKARVDRLKATAAVVKQSAK